MDIPLEYLLRLVITFVFTALFGIERHFSHKSIGFGAFSFVALGASGLAVVSVQIGIQNVAYVIGSVAAGIGFLGAGALIRTADDKIVGLTTSASLWTFAILGIIVGLGLYLQAIVVYLLIWSIVGIDRILEKKHLEHFKKKISITATDHVRVGEIQLIFKQVTKDYRLIHRNYDKETGKLHLCYFINANDTKLGLITKHLVKKPWFVNYSID